tara:strand:+ start:677 stop:919 length:243 start_codon:yes stop_codon:yes gene_type:complete
MDIDEVIRLLREIQALGDSAKETVEAAKPITKRVKKRITKYQRFSKNFQYRKKKRNEASSDYIAARAKAVGRAWRREKRK